MAEGIDPFPRYTSEPGVLLSNRWNLDVTYIQHVPQSVQDLSVNDSIKLELNYENFREFVWVEVAGNDQEFAWGKLVETPYAAPLLQGDLVHFKPEHVFQWIKEDAK